jgi:hypothetical protein
MPGAVQPGQYHPAVSHKSECLHRSRARGTRDGSQKYFGTGDGPENLFSHLLPGVSPGPRWIGVRGWVGALGGWVGGWVGLTTGVVGGARVRAADSELTAVQLLPFCVLHDGTAPWQEVHTQAEP